MTNKKDGLVVGKTGLLKTSPAKAVRAAMQKRVSEGTVERPDLSPAAAPKVRVKITTRR